MGSFLQPVRISPGSSPGGFGLGAAIAYAPPSGVIDPAIVGFNATIGRLKVTLSGNTSFKGLPAGFDGQQLFIAVVAGDFLLTLVHLSGGTALQPIFARNDFNYALRDTAQLFYDAGLTDWILVP